ncbi:AaceriAFR648Wp [[Ashbya] aceris (nom. inval.)]|nr:AaceriAFR648Wp [[Ashbya] aceris (nom. inval.)]
MLRRSYTLLHRRTLAISAGAVEKTDVLIVGGGPAGLTLAAGIKNSPHLSDVPVTLVEGSSLSKIGEFYNSPPPQYHNRIINLTPQSKNFLEQKVGVKLLEDRIQAFDGFYVTDGCSHGALEMARENVGYMAEIFNIQSSVLHRMKQLAPVGLDLIENAKVTSIEHSDPADPQSWPLVTLDNGRRIQTRLLVGADGKNSPVRRFSGIESRGWSYGRWGIVANIRLEYPPFKTRGWQRFLPTGPIAHLPMPGTDACLTWSTTEPLARLLLSLEPAAFATLVNAAFILDDADMQFYYKHLQEGAISTADLIADVDHRTQQVFSNLQDESLIDEVYPPKVVDVYEGSRARFPLSMAHADSYVADRIALVGDAAHSTHPLAGQGLNMGQGDVEALLGALERGYQRGLDLGSLLTLEPYWAERYPINNALIGGADKLHKLYSTDFAPIVAARTFGLNLVDKLGPLKDLIMAKVSGPN